MTAYDKNEQLALMLSLMGDEVAQAAITNLDSETGRLVNEALAGFRADPPSEQEVEAALTDFDSYFDDALNSVESAENAIKAEQQATEASSSASAAAEAAKAKAEADLAPGHEDEESFVVKFEPEKRFPEVGLSGDVKLDLNRLHPYQVAFALKDDAPNTIAIVVQNLAPEHAAKTIEFLPESVRSSVFMLLADPRKVSETVERSILAATAQGARKVEQREAEEDSSAQLAQLMRSMPKEVRMPMIEHLMAENEELGKQVKSQLYQFSDLTRLNDRDIQKVLGQSNSDALVLSLQKIDNEFRDRLLGNMSKRARETILEELEFKKGARQPEIDEARKLIVELLIQLEEGGEISFD